MLERISRQAVTIVMSLLIIGCTIVFGISYYALSKLTFAGDRLYYGRKQSVLAEQIRTELLKRPHISSITFKNEENHTLAGLFIERKNATANAVFCHGFKSCKEFLYSLIDMFPHWNILLFDFRAHGQSEGSISSIGCHEYKDVICAMEYLKNRTKSITKIPSILLGISMGGASVIKAAEQQPDICDAVITDSAYANLDHTLYTTFIEHSGLPEYPFFTIVKSLFQYFTEYEVEKMNPAQCMNTIKQPVLIMHSCNDALIAPSQAIKLFENAANSNSKLWISPHCRHAWLHVYRADLYKQKIATFLNKNLNIKA